MAIFGLYPCSPVSIYVAALHHARCEFTHHVLLVDEEKLYSWKYEEEFISLWFACWWRVLYLLLQSTSKNLTMDGDTYDAICMYKQTGEYPKDLHEMVDKAAAKQKKRLFRKRCGLFVLNEGALFSYANRKEARSSKRGPEGLWYKPDSSCLPWRLCWLLPF